MRRPSRAFKHEPLRNSPKASDIINSLSEKETGSEPASSGYDAYPGSEPVPFSERSFSCLNNTA